MSERDTPTVAWLHQHLAHVELCIEAIERRNLALQDALAVARAERDDFGRRGAELERQVADLTRRLAAAERQAAATAASVGVVAAGGPRRVPA